MGIFALAVAAVLGGFAALGLRGIGRVRTGADYAVAGRSASAPAVVGILLGALVGGASTVGTAPAGLPVGPLGPLVHPGGGHRLPAVGVVLRGAP